MCPADLFSWRAEAEAAEVVAAAEAERAAAKAKRRLAPHGEAGVRQARLQAATLAALQAEVRLQRLRREDRP